VSCGTAVEFTELAVVWRDGEVSCGLSIDGRRYRVSVVSGASVLASEIRLTARHALALASRWRSAHQRALTSPSRPSIDS